MECHKCGQKATERRIGSSYQTELVGESDLKKFFPNHCLGNGICHTCLSKRHAAMLDQEFERRRSETWKKYLESTPPEYRDAMIRDGTQSMIDAVYQWQTERGMQTFLFIGGSTGIGKTRMAWAIAHTLTAERLKTGFGLGWEYLWVDVPDLGTQMLSMGIQQRSAEVYKMTHFGGILIMDDLGNESPLIRRELYPVIQYRSQWSMGTVITSEYSLNDLVQTDGFGERWGSRLASGVAVYVVSHDRRLPAREEAHHG